jgi:hypothetical protein
MARELDEDSRRPFIKIDKQQLIAEAERGGDVTRIPHQWHDWFDRIKRELGRM